MDQAIREPRLLRVFLCHSSDDKNEVRILYSKLTEHGFDPWLDEKKLLPGQEWRYEIARAMQAADVVVICLSRSSIGKEGFVQREIRQALDIADEKPDGMIFLVPVRLRECDVPSKLSRFQWVNLFEADGYERLLTSLRYRASALGILPTLGREPAPEPDKFTAELVPVVSDAFDDLSELTFVPVPAKSTRYHMTTRLVTNKQFKDFLCDPNNEHWKPSNRCTSDGLVDDSYLSHWANGRPKANHEDLPVVYVSYHAATAFARWIGNRISRFVRVPTLEEWQYAARAERNCPDWWVEDVRRFRVAFAGSSGVLTPVGSFHSNCFGLYDLLGNARDMCTRKDGNDLCGVGGYYRSKLDQLHNLETFEANACRGDTSFRLVHLGE